jgi:ATP-dependent protease HslVU (ClpYQ) peptidase subunit
MRKIVSFEQAIGGDGAKAQGGLVIDQGFAKLQVEVLYPLDKALAPAMGVLDVLVAKIEAAIPGDWDKALLEPIKEEAKKKLLEMLSEPVMALSEPSEDGSPV